MYGFVAVSPFIFTHQLGRPDHEVGIYLALQISGVWLGSMLQIAGGPFGGTRFTDKGTLTLPTAGGLDE